MNTEKTATPSEIHSATIRIPGPLRSLAAGTSDVAVPAGTVRAALDDLVRRHPGLLRHFRTEQGDLREHVNVFVNEEDIRHLDGEETAVAPGDTVTVVPSIAGG
jgi:molybdopterin converting factor small subunit